MNESLTILVHAESGMGKSWFGDTAPSPRLILDAEGGSRFTPSSNKVLWDPMTENPPVVEPGVDTTVVVNVRDFATVRRVFDWLNSGQHPFESVVWDSLTEIQKRCLDNIVGINAPRTQDWGTLLREMEALVRNYRDLATHPVKPMACIVFLALTVTDKKGVMRPSLKGQLGTTMPQFVDVIGYLYTQVDESGGLQRLMMTQPFEGYVAKDRTDKLPQVVASPTLGMMMGAIYGNS